MPIPERGKFRTRSPIIRVTRVTRHGAVMPHQQLASLECLAKGSGLLRQGFVASEYPAPPE